MKLCAFLAIFILALNGGDRLHSIHFRGGDLRTNLELAQEQEKLVFVDLTARWCHSCKLMEETLFRDPLVVQLLNENFISLKVNADRIEGKLLAAQENVKTLPALLVLNDEGKRLDLIQHAPSQAELLKMLKSNVKRHSKQQTR
ncbi:MAG: thioredoxin family protein [Saprospiraceae bacterium]|nr:thioredoxin family protein [Saprospiraceae bacterium]